MRAGGVGFQPIARVFTVGLGSGVDKALLSKIAAEKNGRFTFVADAKAVEAEFSKVLEGEPSVSFLPKPLDIPALAERVKQLLQAA